MRTAGEDRSCLRRSTSWPDETLYLLLISKAAQPGITANAPQASSVFPSWGSFKYAACFNSWIIIYSSQYLVSCLLNIVSKATLLLIKLGSTAPKQTQSQAVNLSCGNTTDTACIIKTISADIAVDEVKVNSSSAIQSVAHCTEMNNFIYIYFERTTKNCRNMKILKQWKHSKITEVCKVAYKQELAN